jgi:Caspase domain
MRFLNCLLSIYLVSCARAEPRTALVIGCDYKGTDLELPSPLTDAKAVAAKLTTVGFAKPDISLLENPTLQQLTTAVDAFGAKLKASGGVGLFYSEWSQREIPRALEDSRVSRQLHFFHHGRGEEWSEHSHSGCVPFQ